MTEKYPDLVHLIPEVRGAQVRSFVLEGEVVAIDNASGSVKNFQVQLFRHALGIVLTRQALAGRARKNVEVGNVTQSVCIFAFGIAFSAICDDLTYRSDVPERAIASEYPSTRAKRVAAVSNTKHKYNTDHRSEFLEIKDRFTFVRSIDSDDNNEEDIQAFFKAAIAVKCEGIMQVCFSPRVNLIEQGKAVALKRYVA